MTTRASPDPWALHPHVLLALVLPHRLQEPLPAPGPSCKPVEAQLSPNLSVPLQRSSVAHAIGDTVWVRTVLAVGATRDPLCSGNSLGSPSYIRSLINCPTKLLFRKQFKNCGKKHFT